MNSRSFSVAFREDFWAISRDSFLSFAVPDAVAGSGQIEIRHGEGRVELDRLPQESLGVLIEELFVVVPAPEEITVGFDGICREIDNLGRSRLRDLALGQADAPRNVPAQLVDLALEDAPDAIALGAGASEELLRLDVEDLDVRGEHLPGLDEAPQDDGLDPFALAELESRILVDQAPGLLAHLAEDVLHPLPRRHAKVLGLLEARDQEIGNGLLEIVEGRVARLVLEADHGDGAPLRHFSRNQKKHEQCGRQNGDGDKSGNKDLFQGEFDRDLPRGQARRPGNDALGRRDPFFDLAQFGQDLLGALEPLGLVLFQAFEDQPAEILRDLRVDRSGVAGKLGLLLDGDAQSRSRPRRGSGPVSISKRMMPSE